MKNVIFLLRLKETHADNFTADMMNWYGILEYLGYNVMYEDYRNYESEAFYMLVKEKKPDYIFHVTYEPFHPEFVRLREFSKVYCVHSDDDWRFDNFVKYWIPFTDGAIGHQNYKDAYLKEGASDDYYIRARWAFNPNMMHFEFTTPKKYNLTHVGGFHGDKRQRIDSIKAAGLDVELIDPKFTSYRDYMHAYHQSIVSICLTPNSLTCAPQSKTRLAEMPYYCVLASEPWPNMEMWNMEPNKDFILIDSSQQYIELINKCIADRSFADKMFNSAKRILIEKNTVFHEWDKIMKKIDPDYKGINVNKLISKFQLL